MKTSIPIVGACLAIVVAISSAPLFAAPVTTQNTSATSSNSRIEAMMKRMDRFEQRRDADRTRLYVNRDLDRYAEGRAIAGQRLNR